VFALLLRLCKEKFRLFAQNLAKFCILSVLFASTREVGGDIHVYSARLFSRGFSCQENLASIKEQISRNFENSFFQHCTCVVLRSPLAA
jgi:hypothetical protein